MSDPQAFTNAKLGLLGVGEAFSSGLGNTSFLLYEALEGTSPSRPVPKVLFDCGYQIPERLFALGGLEMEIDAIYITHLHADHAMGLGPLLKALHQRGRKKTLTLWGPKGLESYVRKITDLAYPGSFQKLRFPVKAIPLKANSTWIWKGLRFKTAPTQHSVQNLSVQVRLGTRGPAFFISGDGKPTTQSLALARESEWVFHESFFLQQDTLHHAHLAFLRDAFHRSRTLKIIPTHFAQEEALKIMATLRRHSTKDPRWILAEPGDQFALFREIKWST